MNFSKPMQHPIRQVASRNVTFTQSRFLLFLFTFANQSVLVPIIT